MNTTRDILGELVRVAGRRDDPPTSDYERVLASAHQAWQRKLYSRRKRRWIVLAASVAAAGVIATVMLLDRVPGRAMTAIASAVIVHGNAAITSREDDAWVPLVPGAKITAGSRLRIGDGGDGVALRTSDGIEVRVKPQSELLFESAHSLRLTAGTVYVDSGIDAHGATLSVETEVGTVRDIGTIFEVHSAPRAMRVRIREGRVELTAVGQRAAAVGAKGDALEIDHRGILRRSRFSLDSASWSWAQRLAVAPDIEGRPLLQLLSWVARETGRRLEFEEPGLEAQAGAVVLHGRTRDLSPLQALDLMLSTTDLEYVLRNDDVIVIRKRQE